MRKNFIPALIFLSLTLLQIDCNNKTETTMNELSALKLEMEDIINESGAEVGLAFKELESERQILINAKEMMHAASTMKVPVMIEVFKQAEQGKFSIDDSIDVINEFHSIVDGSPYSMVIDDDSDEILYHSIGKKLPIRELVFHMITVSSNLATNILIEFVDAKNVMATLADLGIYDMLVLRGVEDIKAFNQGLSNRTNAIDMMRVMEAVANKSAGSSEACDEMLQILKQQKFRTKIPAGIPAEVEVANKTGSITKIDHDAAIVYPLGQSPYVLVILTKGIEDHKTAQELIANLSRLIYYSITGKPTTG